jgi:hypothetical protein
MDKRLITILLMIIAFAVYAQSSNEYQINNINTDDNDTYLGQITVYKYRIETHSYNDGVMRPTAIGSEFVASLYSTNVGNKNYFKIVIDGQTFSVISNPFNGRVSPENYYTAYLLKNEHYVSNPQCPYMAGPYFLSLPFDQSNESVVSSVKTQEASSVQKNQQNKEPEWTAMGKVKAVSDIRTRRNSGEDDVVYDEENAFLYSAFDGKRMKYKLVIARSGEQYDVYQNSSYNGAIIKWSNNGKYVQYLPSLSEMYTHHAGGYYFNVDSTR